ncbi:MAG: Deoxyuridine 5'-triphosphate nucleotidohydrolase [Candidatus Thorarchaeota archaeon]|nr:MAG: Deoxyuridine 5'-triphosphate nucleotidohydrolase [Candidatus Thorarchaeota archaeon]
MSEKPLVVKVKLLSPFGRIPISARKGDAAFDLFSAEEYELKPGERHAISTGIAIEIPEGYEGQVRPRSGLAIKHGITVLNGPGTIDSGFRGEVRSIMINHGEESFRIEIGMRIAQLAIRRVPDVIFEQSQRLESSDRGKGGFGSTGL